MKYFYALLLTIFCSFTQAQNPIGIPQINTYSSLEYKGGTQNWDIDQDENGVLYFANNEGLLSFDGRHWKLYPLPNKTIVRSLKVARDGKIFIGGQDEIGYFFPDKNGVLKFHSLQNLIPEKHRHFSDIWNIVIINDNIYFRTINEIFQLNNGAIKVHIPNHLWEFMGEANGKLYADDSGKGLLIFDKGTWKTVATLAQLSNDYVTAVLDYSKDTLLVTTLKNGLFLMGDGFFTRKRSSYDLAFSKNRIYDAVRVNSQWYAIATASAGCYIIDKEGYVIQQFSSKEGLYKDNLRSIFLDANKNLWLGLNDGINLIAFNNAVKYIYPDKDKQTSSYAALIKDHILYIGTSNGIFSNQLNTNNSDFSYAKQNFQEISNTVGQIWSLKEINGKILAGHEEGALIIENNKVKPLYKGTGTWMFEPFSDQYPLKEIIAGTYYGIRSISLKNGEYINKGHINGISESLRFIIYDNEAIWASHPYRGVYKLRLSPDKTKIIQNQLFTEKNGLPSTLGNYVAKIRGQIVVATLKGIYEFDDKAQKFKPSVFLTPILGNNVYHYLKEDKAGNIWFISNKKVGVVDFKNDPGKNKFNIVHFPELNSQVVAGFENIYPYDNENIFIGANNGLIHINYKKYIQNLQPIKVILSSVKTTGKKDSVIYGGYFINDQKIQSRQSAGNNMNLSKDYNSLHFEYSSTLYEQQNNIEFSYQLKGFDNTWAEWSSKSEKDYTNLPHGKYTFLVKARNNLGNESEPVSFTFVIVPAWYETVWIYLLYALLFCSIIYLIVRRQKRKHLKQQEYLKLAHQREIERSEKEIIKLRNEKLETEVSFKNKELATTSMHLVQKNKLLSKIKTELMPLVKLDNTKEQTDDLKKVLRLLNESERGDADWEHFSVHFDQVHSNFLAKLKEKFPALSSNDLKLCAYLKMNLTSKEIAQLVSITVRAVEVSRYRLRKKLNIPSEINLFDYLIDITS